MSYKFHKEWDSPNYTPNSQVKATWGVPRTYAAIAIHWWGDPKTNPSFKGVVNGFLTPGGVSAHFVATGTNREVAQLVDFPDASWATNSANPFTISIECDPRCRDEDYDVVAEVIAQIRDAYGNLPLVPHNKYVATACPGKYDLARLDKLARTKDGSGDWGTVNNKTVVTTKTETKTEAIAFNKVVREDPTLPKNETKVAQKGVSGVRTITYTVTYTNGKETKRVVKSNVVTRPAVDEVTLVGTYVAPQAPEKPSEVSLDENSTTLLQDVKKLLQELLDALKSIFK